MGAALGLIASPGIERQAWSHLARIYRRDMGWMAAYAIGAAAQSALVLPNLLLLRLAFDRAIPGQHIDLLIEIGVALVLTRLVGSLLALVLRARIVRVMRGATRRLRREILDSLYARSHTASELADKARLHSQIVFETERVDNMADTLLSGTLPAVVTTTILIATLLYLNAWLVAIGAVFLPLVWFAGRVTGSRMRADVRRFQSAFEDFGHGMRFVLDHLPLTRARAAEAWEIARQDAVIERLRDAAVRMADGSARHSHAQSNLVGLPGVMLLVCGGIAVAHGVMTLGSFLVFYVAAGQLNGQLDRLSNAIPAFITGNESLSVLWRLREQGPPEPYAGTRGLDWRGEIALRDVSFGYTGRLVLREVSLVLRPGERIAIVGPNGAGKTTLINLILGFYRPVSGRLEADGVPYDSLDLRALRREIGLVPQHPALFDGTVFENIAYGRPEATRADALTAMRAVSADSLLARWPEGLDTRIGEAAALLSGGQRQLLALARARLGHPRLLILDEPTNHLDLDAIGRLMAAMEGDPDRPAILLISHDPAVVAYADSVWRIEDGVLRAAALADEPVAGA